MISNKLKKIKNDISLGVFSKTSDSQVIEILCNPDADFIILDMEHSYNNLYSISEGLKLCIANGIVPIVRVPNFQSDLIGKALDAGAYGIQVSNIKSDKETKKIIDKFYFHPLGNRGLCRYVPAAKFGSASLDSYLKEAQDKLLIIQIENVGALTCLKNICKLKGIDILFIGPYDLSQSLGYPGQIERPEVIDSIKMIIEKANEYKIKTGIYIDDIKNIKKWKNIGVSYFACSVDLSIFNKAVNQHFSDAKEKLLGN